MKLDKYIKSYEWVIDYIPEEDVKKILWDNWDDFCGKSIWSTRLIQGFYPRDVEKYMYLKSKEDKEWNQK